MLADGSRSTESLDSLGDQTLENKIKGGARLCWWAACFSCPCCTFEAFLKQWWILSLINIAHCTVRKLHKHFFTAVMFEYFARKEWPSSCLYIRILNSEDKNLFARITCKNSHYFLDTLKSYNCSRHCMHCYKAHTQTPIYQEEILFLVLVSLSLIRTHSRTFYAPTAS